MKLTLKTSDLTLHYGHPIPVRGKKLSSSVFLLCELTDDDGFQSKLPLNFLKGLHQEEKLTAKFKLQQFFKENTFTFNHPDFHETFFKFTSSDTTYSGEMLFHIETLLLNHWLKKYKTNIPHAKCNGIISNDHQSDAKKFDCLKIKITPSMEHEKILSAMMELKLINPEMRFRLDGNRQFSTAQINTFLKCMDHLAEDLRSSIDYFEEPLQEFADHYHLQAEGKLPVALDESVLPFYQAGLLGKISDFIWVFKPSLFGLSSLFRLMDQFPEQRCVISSTFEHPDQIPCLHFLASRCRPMEYHGLTPAPIALINH